jgi:hypothetical protein
VRKTTLSILAKGEPRNTGRRAALMNIYKRETDRQRQARETETDRGKARETDRGKARQRENQGFRLIFTCSALVHCTFITRGREKIGQREREE